MSGHLAPSLTLKLLKNQSLGFLPKISQVKCFFILPTKLGDLKIDDLDKQKTKFQLSLTFQARCAARCPQSSKKIRMA